MNFQYAPGPSQFYAAPPYYHPYPVNHGPAAYPFPPGHNPPLGYPLLQHTGDAWYIPHSDPERPVPVGQEAYQTRTRQPSATISALHQGLVIDVFWNGRIGPLPGFSSSPHMGSLQTKAIEIKDPVNNQTPLGLPKNNELEKTDSFTFDKYAQIFVPRFLKNIQEQAQTLKILDPIPSFPPSLYITSFLPDSIIEKIASLYPSSLLAIPPPSKSGLCPPLNAQEYRQHWNCLLSWELEQLAADKQKIIFWQMKIRALDWKNSEFAISSPGIRENYPRLDIGDILQLREILVEWQIGSGIAFEGRVISLRKREGFIHFYCPALKQHIERYIPPAPGQETSRGLPIYKAEEEVPPVFNVSFLTNARPSVVMDVATLTLGGALAINGQRDMAHRWMFPELEDLHLNPPIPSTPPNITGGMWIDNGLNTEQRLAASAISMYQSPVPFLIYGPPGTGKTRTVVESVHQILRTQPEAHILLCAPSNPATDTLAQRLGVSLKPGDMLRLNDQNRTFAEVPDPIRQFCYVENDRFALPPWKSLMSYRVVVTSCLDANILVEALCTNSALCEFEKHTMMSLHPHRIMKHQIIPHWTHLLIDEAAQGSEPELLVPISVVLTRTDLFDGDQSHSEIPNTTSACYHPLATTPQLCLCGDPNQLGPIITSPEARNYELDLSLLERLFGRPLYAQHPEARHASLPIHQSSVCAPFKPFVNLVKNYRSDPAILMPASALFYNESLEPCASNGLISWQGLSNNKFPVMFLGCDANDESVDERATWFNLGEIEHIFNVITSLMSEASKSFPTLQPEEIGVLAPWREQVWKVREKLRQASLSRVDVGTVEDFQGREKRVVIISCVRSSARFLSEDKQKGIGLVFEKKRMNVAITRAKELLVIIGNGNLLKCDPYWKGFLQFASRNNLYVGPELNIEDDGAWISRLESKFAQVDEENGLATHTGLRNTMMLAGGVVREVLREDF